MNIYLVRHGETDWNVQGIIQGHTDIPLNERGLQQAKSASRFFKDLTLDAIYSSDLMRASRTAELLTGRKPETSEGIRERFCGDLEGKHVSEKPKFQNHGETEKALMDRMERNTKKLVAKSMEQGHKNILIVAHGACLRALIKRLTLNKDIDAGDFRNDIVGPHHSPFPNCCLIEIRDKKLTKYAQPLAVADANNADEEA